MSSSGSWYLEHQGSIYIYKNNQQLKVEGNFKEGTRPDIEWVHDVRPYTHDGKDYVVVSIIPFI